jgi:hypothetical protein
MKTTIKRLVIPAFATAIVAAVMAMGSPWSRPAALARMPYDGLWSVSIITDAGTCDRGYRYAVHIVNGLVTYDDPNFDIHGAVDARGQVVVTIRAGQNEARGSGRLSGDYGEGNWSGSSPTARCSGHWEAERRG